CAIRKVDTGAAQARLDVDGCARTNVVADVRDVDVQGIVAVGELIHPDRVVEIASGFPIDGDDRHVAKVAAAAQFGIGNRLGNGLRLLDYFGRELVRQVVFANNDLDIDA